MKKLFKGKFFQKVLAPAVRGLVKSVPFTTPVVEIATNLMTKKKLPKKHTNLSVVIQIISIAAIVFAFYKKWIPLEQMLEFLGFI